VTAHFDVRADGGVEHCRVVASSGSTLLDETTCRLIEARFRYVPARDATGAAITDIAGWRQDWWLGGPKQ
jgi:protein TonB